MAEFFVLDCRVIDRRCLRGDERLRLTLAPGRATLTFIRVVRRLKERAASVVRWFQAAAALSGVLLAAGSFVCFAQSATAPSGGVQQHLQRAREALKANAADAAIREYLAVLNLDPKNVEAQANLGVIAFFQGDCAKASGYLSGALAIQPSIPKAQALLGICEKRLGNPAGGARLEKSFSELSDPKLKIQVGTELAGLYYQRGDLRKTASLLQSLVDFDPDNADILYFSQLVYEQLSDEMLAKLAVVAPGSARMQQVIGERLINAGDLSNAIEHFRKALKADPALAGVRYELSEALFQSSPSDVRAQTEATQLLAQAAKIEGDSAKIECEMGAIALQQAELDTAYKHYRRAFDLNPKDTEAQMGLARLLADKRKPEEAIPYLKLAIEADPLNGEAHYRLGLAYRDTGSMDAAGKELKLFQDIKKTKDQVKELYRQMNKQTPGSNDRTDDAPKNN
ncbi:MAG TPA: tetratricopeptide repeat protein [Blastocatellia bacterium]|nr:tetratricopeptide repeat protein [Blastocatellia bacterium]